MAWSTRQLAELAGTSLRTVRHYHDVGLLAEPERADNGYKLYRVEHLVRVMRVKRLSELGFSLPQIAQMGEADRYPDEALRAMDAELGDTIKRLHRIRTEMALLLEGSNPTELSPQFAVVTARADMAQVERSLSVVMERLLNESAMEAFQEVLRTYRVGPIDVDFTNLPAAADEETRSELAERMFPPLLELLAPHPVLLDPTRLFRGDPRFAVGVVRSAMVDLYNPAQIDVASRVGRALLEATERSAER